MSKKVNTQEVATSATTEQSTPATVSLETYFTQYPNVSLRRLALATDLSYNMMLTKSKQPKSGEVYDPNTTNWLAVENYLLSKKVELSELNWEEMNEVAARNNSTLVKDTNAFKVGDKVYLRRNNETPYEILYKTDSHIVIMLEGTSEPQSWAITTFMFNGPVFEPRAITSPKIDMA